MRLDVGDLRSTPWVVLVTTNVKFIQPCAFFWAFDFRLLPLSCCPVAVRRSHHQWSILSLLARSGGIVDGTEPDSNTDHINIFLGYGNDPP